MPDPVLVLNANFEPINICGIRRAIGLILMEKAAMVLNGRGEIHTPTTSIPYPSIIRLKNMVHRPRQCINLNRKEVFRRDHFTCQYCGKISSQLTIDHVQPRHLGGQHIWSNVVAACSACNHKKGARPLESTNMFLLKQPQEPPSSATYLYGHLIQEYQDWEPFINGW